MTSRLILVLSLIFSLIIGFLGAWFQMESFNISFALTLLLWCVCVFIAINLLAYFLGSRLWNLPFKEEVGMIPFIRISFLMCLILVGMKYFLK